MEIQECIELLNQYIGGSVESIKGAVTTAFDQRDYDKMTELQEMMKKIDETQNKLDEYSNMLQLDDDVEDSIIEVDAVMTGRFMT